MIPVKGEYLKYISNLNFHLWLRIFNRIDMRNLDEDAKIKQKELCDETRSKWVIKEGLRPSTSVSTGKRAIIPVTLFDPSIETSAKKNAAKEKSVKEKISTKKATNRYSLILLYIVICYILLYFSYSTH